MKYRTSELFGGLLDAAVARAVNKTPGLGKCLQEAGIPMFHPAFRPGSLWEHGGPIIERELITVVPNQGAAEEGFEAMIDARGEGPYVVGKPVQEGETYLVAAMRAFVAAKIGEEVDL